jgi:probable rRNA maturation factor
MSEQLLETLEVDSALEVSLLLTDDEEIRELNRDFRGLNEPTDVLSFALRESEDAELTPELLGDIAVSVETAARIVNSGEHRARVCEELGADVEWGLGEELSFLAIHGALHLLGHDHAEPAEEAEMKSAERTAWFALRERVGVAPP